MAYPLAYRQGELWIDDVALRELAATYGTPLYVYSDAELTRAYRAFDEALAGLPHRVCFSVKANSNLSILKRLAELGAGADIVSGGELHRWLQAGGAANRVVFSGVGKTAAEMRLALEAGIYLFNVESAEELTLLNTVAGAMNARARVALRVNPDVDPQTHPYISTGLKQNKFGVSMAEALPLLRAGHAMPNIVMAGIDCHIGSQLTKTEPFADAIAHLVELMLQGRAEGLPLAHLDIGGGLGIDYQKDDQLPPTPAAYGNAVRAALAPLTTHGIELICEPGRVIVGQAGVLLASVIYRKRNEAKHFTIVDAAMNDLMRPALYGSHHPMWPVRGASAAHDLDARRPTHLTDVVGPICETGDFLARDRMLPELDAGELLAIGAAGAYGATMASNYNTRPRAAEVLVSGDRHRLIRRRETLEQLLTNELNLL